MEAPEGEEPAVVEELGPSLSLPAAAKAKKPEPLPKWMRDRLALMQTARSSGKPKRACGGRRSAGAGVRAEDWEAIHRQVDSKRAYR